MKRVFAFAVCLAIAGIGYACDELGDTPAPTRTASLKSAAWQVSAPAPTKAPTFRSLPAESAPATRSTQEELEFLATGPRLFTMDDALKVSAKTGKPVVCWMGKHIFADKRAREASLALGDTTIQATMDTDGETHNAKGEPLPPLRVKFSSGNYEPTAKVAYIPVSKLTKDSPAKILKFVRGADGR